MKQKFKEWNPRGESRERVELCNGIIDGYQRQGLVLTLRQLYYQLVTRNEIRNTEREYKNLGTLISQARLSGMMDWDAIEDRVRRPIRPNEFTGLTSLVNAAIRSYRLPRWRGQGAYAELWVEKDALAGVLEPIADRFHATLMVNRGYSSQSAMYESARRIQNTRQSMGAKSAYVFYLGDHDPSGEDMVRDVEERLQMFGVTKLRVTKIALTRAQVDEYGPPPNPAKLSDSRAAKYCEEHGDESWEVDALPPETLNLLVEEAFERVLDLGKMRKVEEQEEVDKQALRRAVQRIVRRRDTKEDD